jgi:mono/diheme cytochrome c family protein
VLGLSAIQLSRHDRGPTLADLTSAGLLSHPPKSGVDYPVPGDPTTAAALGYLHANCGHCHNENGTSWPDTQMVLRLNVGERAAAGSQLYTSLVGQKLQYWRGGAITLRVAPGDPDTSAVTARMHTRGSKDQMPPLATEIVDLDGFALVRDWIKQLP